MDSFNFSRRPPGSPSSKNLVALPQNATHSAGAVAPATVCVHQVQAATQLTTCDALSQYLWTAPRNQRSPHPRSCTPNLRNHQHSLPTPRVQRRYYLNWTGAGNKNRFCRQTLGRHDHFGKALFSATPSRCGNLKMQAGVLPDM